MPCRCSPFVDWLLRWPLRQLAGIAVLLAVAACGYLAQGFQANAPALGDDRGSERPAPAATEGVPLFPPELTEFRPIAANPVFTAAGPDDWDARIRERGWIMREGDVWRMWYTGYDGKRESPKHLGYATSADGIRWVRHQGNPIYMQHWVEDMMVVHVNDAYYMFAEGRDDQAHLLRSPDGLQWTRVGQLDVRRTDGQPIEPGPYGTPTAWYEDGVWHLFYERRDAGVWHATSEDMKVWRNVQDEPVLVPGPGAYDSEMIALNQIVKYRGHYYAYYHGAGPAAEGQPRIWSTAVAVSDDLNRWQKYPGNPLLPTADNKSSGILVHDGQGFRLYTMHDRVDCHFSAVPVKQEPRLPAQGGKTPTGKQ